MTDLELKQLLQQSQVPSPDQAGWARFTGQVMENVRATSSASARPVGRERVNIAWPWVWGTAIAAICLLIGFGTGFWKGKTSLTETEQIAAMQKYFREIQTLFPHQVRAVAYDDKGASILLSDAANVPVASPVYLEIKGARGTRRYVTFSGEKIQINGEECEVLESAAGHIMLVGKHFLWTENQPTNARYQIHARTLPAIL